MSRLLRQLVQQGEISWLSFHFADFIARHGETDLDDLVPLSAAMVGEANRQSHVCIDLTRRDGHPLFASAGVDGIPIPVIADIENWRQRLLANPCIGPLSKCTPFTLDATRLYLNRYWRYEDRVAGKLRALAATRIHAIVTPRIGIGRKTRLACARLRLISGSSVLTCILHGRIGIT